MDSSRTRVIAVVGQHWLMGGLQLGGTRIQDFLQEDHTDFVHLHDVHVCRDAEGESPLAILPQLVVPKNKIEFVITCERRHEAPVKRINNLTCKTPVNVFLVLSRYYIQGKLHLPVSTNDSIYALTTHLGRFFPITQVSVSGPGTRQRSAAVLLANKDFVSCFYIGDSANPERETAKQPPIRHPEKRSSPEENLLELVKDFSVLE